MRRDNIVRLLAENAIERSALTNEKRFHRAAKKMPMNLENQLMTEC
jgi:hypothetical protein